LEFFDDRVLQIIGASHRGIFGKAIINGLLRSLLDILGRIKIWLARTKTDNVDSLSLH
jgi:hypothetical protein